MSPSREHVPNTFSYTYAAQGANLTECTKSSGEFIIPDLIDRFRNPTIESEEGELAEVKRGAFSGWRQDDPAR